MVIKAGSRNPVGLHFCQMPSLASEANLLFKLLALKSSSHPDFGAQLLEFVTIIQ